MPSVSRAYAESRYGQLHYRIAGGPTVDAMPPLLCLHQTPSSGKEWMPILDRLAERRIVVAPDTPGYGMSDAPPEPARIEDFAGTMIGLLDQLVLSGILPPGPVDVMGMHTGSVIATELARAYPQRIRRGVLFGLAAYPEELRREKLARLRDNFPVPDDSLHHVEKLWSIIGAISDARVSAEERHIGMAECLRLGTRMPWGYISVYRYDFLGAMAQVEQPILVVNPEDDLWEVTRTTSHLFRNGRRHDMPGVAHGVLTIERETILDLINGFLNGAAA